MKFNRSTALLAGSAVLFVTACTDPDRFAGSDPNSNTKAGAVVGAVTGAIIGSKVSSDEDRGKGALIGAVIGAGTGAAVGNRLDQQEADLRRDLGNDQVRIQNTGDRLIVTMPQDILFPVDSASVRTDLRRDLGALAGNLMAYPNTVVDVVGHTDNTGSADYNLGLSQRRADAVGNILIDNGVPSQRIRTIGRGENQPIANNLTAEGRAQNRRVEIIITPVS